MGIEWRRWTISGGQIMFYSPNYAIELVGIEVRWEHFWVSKNLVILLPN